MKSDIHPGVEKRRVAFERDTRLRCFDLLPIHMGEGRLVPT